MVFDKRQEYSGAMGKSEFDVQVQTNSILQNYIQTIFGHVKKSTEDFYLTVKGDIMSLVTSMSQDVRRILAKIVKRVDAFTTSCLQIGWRISFALSVRGKLLFDACGIVNYTFIPFFFMRHFSFTSPFKLFHYHLIKCCGMASGGSNVRLVMFICTNIQHTSADSLCQQISRYHLYYLPVAYSSLRSLGAVGH